MHEPPPLVAFSSIQVAFALPLIRAALAVICDRAPLDKLTQKIFVDSSIAPNFYCLVGALPFPMALPLPVTEFGRWEASRGSSGLTKATRSSAERATYGRNPSANFEASSQEPDLNGEESSTNEQTPDAEDIPRSADEMAQKRRWPHFTRHENVTCLDITESKWTQDPDDSYQETVTLTCENSSLHEAATIDTSFCWM
jgi:hypothetical protein